MMSVMAVIYSLAQDNSSSLVVRRAGSTRLDIELLFSNSPNYCVSHVDIFLLYERDDYLSVVL